MKINYEIYKECMNKLDKYEIKHELAVAYITKDGKSFLDIDKAIRHQKKILHKYYV